MPIILVLPFVLWSCHTLTLDSLTKSINPGDEIDGMLFTSDDEFSYTHDIAAYCDEESMKREGAIASVTCPAFAGDDIFFGNCAGVAGDTMEKRDQEWQSFNMEMTFDDQPINLSAFGFLEFSGPDGWIRVWNVKVENLTAGKHTIECDWEWERENESRTAIIQLAVDE